MDVLIDTQAGTVRGVACDGYAAFRAIPYAAPLMGAARFLPPSPAHPWAGVRDARYFGASVPQPVVWSPGDDPECLTVNVWTPNPKASTLPVLVWLHGGACMGGTAATTDFDGSAYAREGVVLVTVNYRVGYEGFGWVEGVSCNRGVLDQIAGLRWVRGNIAAFGGNPEAVTLIGQSAGASSIVALIAGQSAAKAFRTRHRPEPRPHLRAGRRSPRRLVDHHWRARRAPDSAGSGRSAVRGHPCRTDETGCGDGRGTGPVDAARRPVLADRRRRPARCTAMGPDGAVFDASRRRFGVRFHARRGAHVHRRYRPVRHRSRPDRPSSGAAPTCRRRLPHGAPGHHRRRPEHVDPVGLPLPHHGAVVRRSPRERRRAGPFVRVRVAQPGPRRSARRLSRPGRAVHVRHAQQRPWCLTPRPHRADGLRATCRRNAQRFHWFREEWRSGRPRFDTARRITRTWRTPPSLSCDPIGSSRSIWGDGQPTNQSGL